MITDFRLKLFLEVVQTLSFTKSAQSLNITQPAVTKHIQELERQMGCALFIRHGNSISPTPDAMRLVRYARRVIGAYKELNNAMQADTTDFEGELRLGASTTLAQYILPSLLAKFKQRYARIDVTLDNGNSEQIARKIIDQTIDFAVVEGDQNNASLHYENFAQDKIVLVTNAGNTAQNEPLTLESLRLIPLLIRENGSGTLSVVEHALRKQGITRKELNIAMQLGGSESIVRYLMSSHSFAFISLAAVADYLHRKVLRVVEVEKLDIERTLRFVSLHGRQERLSEIFKTFCLENYNQKL